MSEAKERTISRHISTIIVTLSIAFNVLFLAEQLGKVEIHPYHISESDRQEVTNIIDATLSPPEENPAHAEMAFNKYNDIRIGRVEHGK